MDTAAAAEAYKDLAGSVISKLEAQEQTDDADDRTSQRHALLRTRDLWKHVLLDLGYLTALDKGQIDGTALRAFARDLNTTPGFATFRRAGEALLSGAAFRANGAQAAHIIAEALLDHLSDLLSLDRATSETAARSDRPIAGKTDLWSRIVKARLERLGVGVTHHDAPWQAGDDAALRTLARALAPEAFRPWIDIWNTAEAQGQPVTHSLQQGPQLNASGADYADLLRWRRAMRAELTRLGLPVTGVQAQLDTSDGTGAIAPPTPAEIALLRGKDDRWIALSGDSSALIALWQARDPGGWLVARSKPLAAMAKLTRWPVLKLDSDGAFDVAFLAPLPSRRAKLVRERKLPLFATADDALEDMSNTIGLRLVQISLWQRGFYLDRVDGQLGKNSSQAIADAMESFSGSHATKDAIRNLDDGLAALSLSYLDENIFKPSRDPQPRDGEQMDAEIANVTAVVAAKNQEGTAGRKAVRQFMERIRDGTRRVLGTFRRIAAIAVAGVRRGFQRAAKALDKMVAPLRSLLAAARSALSAAIRYFKDAARAFGQFALGIPFAARSDNSAQSAVIATRFYLFGDAASVAANNPGAALVGQQLDEIADASEMLQFNFSVFGVVLKISRDALLGPFGWARIVLRIIALTRSMISKHVETGQGLLA